MGNPRQNEAEAERHVLAYLQSYECLGADEYALSSAMGSVDDYVNGPYPLRQILLDLERKGEIERVSDVAFRLTTKGRARLEEARA